MAWSKSRHISFNYGATILFLELVKLQISNLVYRQTDKVDCQHTNDKSLLDHGPRKSFDILALYKSDYYYYYYKQVGITWKRYQTNGRSYNEGQTEEIIRGTVSTDLE